MRPDPAWFTMAAGKARIKDDELCDAIEEVRKGQADDLGGGAFKKRLIALRAGYPLRLDRIKPDTFMPAMIHSFDGDLAALREELAALRR